MAALDLSPHGFEAFDAAEAANAAEAAEAAALGQFPRQLLDGAGVGVAVLDPSLRYTYVNRALAGYNGYSPDEHVGRTLAEILPDIDVEPLELILRQVLADGIPRSTTVEGVTAANRNGPTRWFHNAYHRLESESGAAVGVVGMVLEITEDRRIRERLDRARARLSALDEAATQIGTTLDMQQTCKELTRVLVPRLADLAAVDILEPEHDRAPDPGSPLRMRRLALSTRSNLVKAGRHLGTPGATIEVQASSLHARCMASHQAVVANVPTDEQLLRDAPEAGRLIRYRRLGLHSAMAVPLIARRQMYGVAMLVRAGDSPPFSAEDADFAEAVVARAAGGISHAQRFAREHETALALQRALMSEPTSPHPDVECAGRYLPAGAGAEVGGDWYDSIALPDGRTLLTVGDVMGHGLEAASTMAEYRSMMRTLALQGWPPERILARAQRTMAALDRERVATCVLAEVDPASRVIRLAAAGHLPPLLLEPGRPGRLLRLPLDPPLGAGVDDYHATTVRLPVGGALLLYSDGLVERRGEDIDDGLAELAALEFDPAASLERLLDAALARLSVRQEEGFDDVAVLAARIAPMTAQAAHIA
jgi:PAS domain S-box-containing protein